MKKVVDFLKWPEFYLVLALSISYLIWLLLSPMQFIGSDDNRGAFTIGLFLFAIYLISTVLLRLSSNNRVFFYILLAIILLIDIGVSDSFLLDLWWLAMDINGNIYNKIFVFINVVGAIFLIAYLAKIAKRELPEKSGIMRLIMFISTLPLLSINVLYISAFYPVIEQKAQFEGYDYYVISQLNVDEGLNEISYFYKCKKWSFTCANLDFSYHGYQPMAIDKVKKEVTVIDVYGNISYTDGENPRSYALHVGAQLGNHLYFLSEDWYLPKGCDPNASWTCDIYSYILYRCNLDYTSCNPLPIQYSGQDVYDVALEADEATNEINAYNDQTLIFTYGLHPRCYVAGCTITDK